MDEWEETGWVFIMDGITYVEADAVRRWIERADPELAKKWDTNVDHMVRTGIEGQQSLLQKRERQFMSWWERIRRGHDDH